LSCKKSSDNTDDDSVGNSKQQQHHLATPVAAATNLGYKTVAPQQRHLATQAAASTNRHYNIVALHNNAAHQQQPTAALHNNSNQQSRCITTGYLVRFSFFLFCRRLFDSSYLQHRRADTTPSHCPTAPHNNSNKRPRCTTTGVLVLFIYLFYPLLVRIHASYWQHRRHRGTNARYPALQT